MVVGSESHVTRSPLLVFDVGRTITAKRNKRRTVKTKFFFFLLSLSTPLFVMRSPKLMYTSAGIARP